MSGRWADAQVVAQREDGTWTRKDVKVAQRFRMRVISDRANATSHSHQFGHGEYFELLVDTQLDVWVRPFGSSGPFRKDEDAYGVSVVIVDNVTLGVVHDARVRVKPSDPQSSTWSCSCGAGARRPTDADAAKAELEAHLASTVNTTTDDA